MKLKDFVLLPREAQFDLLSDPLFGKKLDGNFEIYFTKSELCVKELIKVLKINATTREGGNNSFRRMIYFILAVNVTNETLDVKEIAQYIVNSQRRYSEDRKKCLEVFLK